MMTFYGFKLHSLFEEDSSNEKIPFRTVNIHFFASRPTFQAIRALLANLLFVCILKQRRKNFCGFFKKEFANFQELNFFLQNSKPLKHIFFNFYNS